MNIITLVGRLASDLEIIEIENLKIARGTLVVQRAYKNCDGIYEVDFIPFESNSILIANSREFLKKGDLIGVKGCLHTRRVENEDLTIDYNMVVVADKISFLASARKEV